MKNGLESYTFMVFHFPFLNQIIAIIAIKDSAEAMATKTPTGPQLNTSEVTYANGNWNIQKQKKLIIVGVFVSPAPLKAMVTVIP